jgi:hypothetical protein
LRLSARVTLAEFYGKTLENYPELKLVGAYDNNKENLESFSRRWCAKKYLSLEQALNDPSVEMVLNLTNPRSHYKVTKMSVEAGKHVYSERPLAMDLETAGELARSRRTGTFTCDRSRISIWTRRTMCLRQNVSRACTILRDYIQSSECLRCWPSLNCTGQGLSSYSHTISRG